MQLSCWQRKVCGLVVGSPLSGLLKFLMWVMLLYDLSKILSVHIFFLSSSFPSFSPSFFNSYFNFFLHLFLPSFLLLRSSFFFSVFRSFHLLLLLYCLLSPLPSFFSSSSVFSRLFPLLCCPVFSLYLQQSPHPFKINFLNDIIFRRFFLKTAN